MPLKNRGWARRRIKSHSTWFNCVSILVKSMMCRFYFTVVIIYPDFNTMITCVTPNWKDRSDNDRRIALGSKNKLSRAKRRNDTANYDGLCLFENSVEHEKNQAHTGPRTRISSHGQYPPPTVISMSTNWSLTVYCTLQDNFNPIKSFKHSTSSSSIRNPTTTKREWVQS